MTDSLSIVIPTYRREQVLLATVRSLLPLLNAGDEILVIDQTPKHEPETEAELTDLAEAGQVRWLRKRVPSQAEAMNLGGQLARGEILVFLDDDVEPARDLLEVYRAAFAAATPPPAICGQVLQPWNAHPVTQVDGYDIRFNTAFNQPCEVLSLIGANFAMPKTVFLNVGGMDENYRGSNYRNDAELAYRIHARTGRKVRFEPRASVRHLYSGGGNRAYGAKDSWGHVGGSIGDYYFAWRWLPWGQRLRHVATRMVRAPLNRHTVRKPWLIPSIAAREVVALVVAWHNLVRFGQNYLKPLEAYRDWEEVGAARRVPALHGEAAAASCPTV